MRLLTIPQVCERTGLSRQVVQRLIDTGAMMAKNFAPKSSTRRVLRVREEWVDECIEMLPGVANEKPALTRQRRKRKHRGVEELMSLYK